MRPKNRICLLPALLLLLCLWGCQEERPEGGSAQGQQSGPGEELSGEQIPTSSGHSEDTGPKTHYQAPEFADSAFHEDQAQGNENARVDLSALSQGYVAVSARSERQLKFQVVKDDVKYNYNIASDGTPSVFPLQSGDGSYCFRVMENVSDTKYAELYSETAEVTLENEFQPFLRPSDYVPYTRQSACVAKAEELAEDAGDELEVVGGIFEYICETVTYDKEKAETVKTGYLPDPDETMGTGKGICFDYAALAAAMLRSQGIPTKMIFGNVSPNDLYHAWNMFYTEKTGWVTVSYEVKDGGWNRLDLTFSANDTDQDFIGDGSNYADVYFY